jgi:RHS repeat-associated protein
VITDSASAKVQAVTYYPYGATRTNLPGTPVNVPYKYTGKELDNTGLYYYEARYYDAVLGRFISADTIVPDPEDPQDLNRYSYVDNNPLRYTDPTGHAVSCATNDGSYFCNSLATQNGQAIVSSYFQPQVAESTQSRPFPTTSAKQGKRNLPPAQMSGAQVG